MEEKNMDSNNKAVLFARANSGAAAIDEQVRALTKFADANGITLVDKVILSHCSANDYEVEVNLTAILGRRRDHNDFTMVIVTDLSRLSRRGVSHGMCLIRRLAKAGVAVVTPDLGVVNESLLPDVPLSMTERVKWTKKSRATASAPVTKGCSPNEKHDPHHVGEKENTSADAKENSADAPRRRPCDDRR